VSGGKPVLVAGQTLVLGTIEGKAEQYVMLPGDQTGLHAQVQFDLGPGLRLIIEDMDPDEKATRAFAIARLIKGLLETAHAHTT